MKSIILILFLIGLSIEIQSIEKDHISNFTLRDKRQDDQWGRTHFTLPETATTPMVKAAGDEEDNPCLNKEYSPKPDFSSPTRRISEIKCYEYMWEMQLREEQDNRSLACTQYRIKHRGPNDPYFAIGGRDTEPGEFPHMGAIGWKAAIGTWVFKCGSSLISPNFVLTAAHCSSASKDTSIADPVPKIVRLGDKNILDKSPTGFPAKDHIILRIINHPNYASPKKYNDIALMELQESVIFTKYIQPACLWGRYDLRTLGKQATLTGWGVVETGSRKTSPELQAAVVDLIPSKVCDRLLRPSCNRHWCGIQNHQLCAGKLEGGVDACEGDSGGPLQVKIPLQITSQGSIHFVIGVTSFGIGCAHANLPGIYTRVSSFIEWIEDIVWK